MKRILPVFLLILGYQLTFAQALLFKNDFDGVIAAPNFNFVGDHFLVEDKFGNPANAVSYPGNTRRMNLNYSSQSANLVNSSTVSFWYKHDFSSGSRVGGIYPFFFVPNGATNFYEAVSLGVNTSGGISFGGSSGNLGNNVTDIGPITAPSSFAATNWNFYTITFGNNELKLYINGELISTKLYSGVNSNADKRMHFGSFSMDNTSGSAAVTGKYDNIKVYSGIMSAANVQNLYAIESAGVPVNNLYKHDFDNTKDAPSFLVGSSLTLTTDKFGNTNNAINLPTNHNTLRLNYTDNASSLAIKGTVSFWFKYQGELYNAINSETYPFFYVPNGNTNYHEGIALSYNANNGKLRFGTSNGTASTTTSRQDIPYTLNVQWHYYTITYYDNVVKLYIDGVFVIERPFYPLTSTSAPRMMHFGSVNAFAGGAGAATVRGEFDNIAVYGKAFSAADVTQDYQNQLSTNGGTLNVNDIKGKSNLSVFPNPVKDYLNIVSDSEIADVKIFNSNGQAINFSREDKKLNLSHLESGMYFMNIVLKDNTSKSIKIMKK